MQHIEQLVGERIAQLRVQKGWNQEELAHRAGLNRAHLYRLEKGLQSMTLKTLKTLADTLGVCCVDLVKDL